MRNVTMIGVPTVVVVDGKVITLVGSGEIKEKLGDVLDEE